MIPNAKVYHLTNIPLSGAAPLDFFVPRSNNFITIKNALSPDSASYPLYLAFDSNSYDSGDYISLDNNESYTAQSWGHFYLMSSAYTTSIADIILSKGGDQQETQEVGEDPFMSFIYTGPGVCMFTSSAESGAKYQIDWGDGTVENLTANGSTISLNHSYSAGRFLTRFKYYEPSKIINLDFRNNNFSGSVPNISRFPNIQNFSVFNNKLTGSIPNLDNNSKLSVFYVISNQLTGYTPSVLPITLTNFQAQNNLLPQSAVDQILTDFATNAANRPNVGVINLSGTGNAAPTAAVKAACETALKTAPFNWAITTN